MGGQAYVSHQHSHGNTGDRRSNYSTCEGRGHVRGQQVLETDNDWSDSVRGGCGCGVCGAQNGTRSGGGAY